MKLVRAVQTSKKSTFESMEIHSLVKLDFGRTSFGSSCFEKKTLDKYFIGRLLVYCPKISVFRYPKTPWDSNAHCLN